MASTHRTFVAVPVAPELEQRAGVLIGKLRATSANVKWVEPRNLHWTIKFLGEVALRETADICKAVQAAVAPFCSIRYRSDGSRSFP